jgi:glycosyltransferase involved in cell wall biosynthesis
MPRVSVVVRTKDRPAFLKRALTDIAAQTFSDWEVVVVNDGGDGHEARAIVDRSSLPNRVTVVDSADPGGRCVAANEGVRASTGEYVVLHDDDDRWAPEFLARTIEWLDSHPRDVGVMVSTAIVYEEQRGDGWVEVERTPFWAGMSRLSLIELLEINRAVPISFLYRRSLHESAGWYDESLDAVEDWDFYLRVVAVGSVGFIPGEPLALWTQRPRARGADANSMFALGAQHAHDDLLVRDRALAEWISENGAGLPLYMALIERRVSETVRKEVASLRQEIAASHPIWSRIRKLWHRLRSAR